MKSRRHQAADEEKLLQFFEHVIPDIVGRQSAVMDINRRQSKWNTSYNNDILTIQLDNGDKLKVFLKNFGSYKFLKNTMQMRREREMRVYKDLLSEANLGTAEYFGHVWDESHGRFWLFLEYVKGTRIRYCEFEDWIAAAVWLGRFHGYFTQEYTDLSSCDFLLRHDTLFFMSTAEQALNSVARFSSNFQNRLSPIICKYDDVVRVISSLPKILVHGAYRPEQIFVDKSIKPSRICPLDWELAAIDSGFYDLAFIADGFEPPKLDLILNNYRKEALKHGIEVPNTPELKHIVNCYRLHRVFNWLSHAFERRYKQGDVYKLLNMADQLADQLF